MARITVEDCLKNVKNRFELVLIAAKRARDITRKGIEPFVPWENDKATVVALREVADGLIDKNVLHEEPVSAEQEVSVQEQQEPSDSPVMPQISLSSAPGAQNTSTVLPEVMLTSKSVDQHQAPEVQAILLAEGQGNSGSAGSESTVDSQNEGDSGQQLQPANDENSN